MAFSVFDIENALGALGRSQFSGPVSLDTTTFTGMEVPSVLRVGGQQRLVIHNLPGGDRIVDVAGNDENRIELAGTFTGPTALSRAQALQKARQAGKAIPFVSPAISARVIIYDYAYDYQSKGVVIPYRLTLEVLPPPKPAAAVTSKDLTSLVGDDIGGAIKSVSSAASQIGQQAENYIGQFQTVVGQVTPIANLVGAGGIVSKITDKLTMAQGVAQGASDLAQLPSAAASTIDDLKQAGLGLSTLAQKAGQNIESISLTGGSFAAGMNAIAANAQLQLAAVSAGALNDRAIRNATTATGGTQTAPTFNPTSAT